SVYSCSLFWRATVQSCVSSVVFPVKKIDEFAFSASTFQKCNRKEPDFDECVLTAAQGGLAQLTHPVKEISFSGLEPVEILELKIEAGHQTVAVDQNFKNCKLYGLSKTRLSKFRFDFDRNGVDVAGFIPEIKKVCEYELDGKVLLLPIKGEGTSTVILRDINSTLTTSFEETKKDGETYMKFKNTKFAFDPGFVSFNFENLFNGDKELGDNINKVLNDNWQDVFQDVKSGYEQALSLVAEGIINQFFTKLSAEDVFD
ncbi:JHBP domain containing protein, partial [Asbolus verrucosus]